MQNKTLGIALLGKGSTNHLHRQEIIDALATHGISVLYLTHPDYLKLLTNLDNCRYSELFISINEDGFIGFLKGLLKFTRSLYPSNDEAKKFVFSDSLLGLPLRTKAFRRCLELLARYRLIMLWVLKLEQILYRYGPGPSVVAQSLESIDLLCMIGYSGIELQETNLLWWAKFNNIPVINVVANYDNLSTKGFRGVDLDRLLVWGPNMKHDAILYQGIPESYISEIGSFRYNTLAHFIFSDKETFFKRHGLNPEKKTIFFGGSRDDFHYFEMLDIFESELTQNNCQLILRIMPNKELMESPQIRTLIAHGRNTKGVFVSIGSPHYAADEAVGDPLTIEEYELWHGLRYCDVVVNLYSTLALEGCIFDKPVIHMWYFRSRGKLTLRQPIYVPYNQEAHIRRFREFGCSDEVFSREELVESIFNQLENPIKQKDARQRLVKQECGDLSGNAYSNFVNVCLDTLGLE